MEKVGLIVNISLVENHNLYGDDVKELTTDQLKTLPRYTRFEKEFPFYKMDINGFGMHLKAAMNDLNEEESASIIKS